MEREEFAPLLVFEAESPLPGSQDMWTVCPMPFDPQDEEAWADYLEQMGDTESESRPQIYGLAVGEKEDVRFGQLDRGGKGTLRFKEELVENLPVDVTAVMVLEELARYAESTVKTRFSLSPQGMERLKQLM